MRTVHFLAERKNMAVRWMGLRFFYHLPIQKIRRENVQYYIYYYKNKNNQITQQSPAVLSSVGFLCNYFRFPSFFLVFNDPFCHVTKPFAKTLFAAFFDVTFHQPGSGFLSPGGFETATDQPHESC